VEVPLPGGRDLNRALRIYVAGRNRAWTADEKREAAGGDVRRGPAVTGPTADPDADPDAETRTGVPVPDSLQFHRGPGTWRGEMPGGRRLRRGPRDS
jgi:hypothetical protein